MNDSITMETTVPTHGFYKLQYCLLTYIQVPFLLNRDLEIRISVCHKTSYSYLFICHTILCCVNVEVKRFYTEFVKIFFLSGIETIPNNNKMCRTKWLQLCILHYGI